MSTITVLSWNVESFGAAKAAIISPAVQGQPPPVLSRSQIVDFIGLVAKSLNIDVIGIMEIKSGIGVKLKEWLLSVLNNNVTNGSWKAAVSSRQDGGTQEEYLYVWKSSATFDLDMNALPGPTSLVNVADTQAFAGLFAAANVTTASDQSDFLLSLIANGYLIRGTWRERSSNKKTKTYRVNPDIWQSLKNGTAVKFDPTKNPPPPVTFSAQQLTQIGSILTQLDVLRFVTYGDRSPYLINLTLDTKPLTLALYHAPGPQDPTRFEAINIIGMSLPLAATGKNMVLMGDFNIARNQMSNNARVYRRAPAQGNPNGVVFSPVSPQQMDLIFNPIMFAPLNTSFSKLPFPTYTSLTSKFLTNKTTLTDTQGNIYDNFYYRNSGTAGSQLTLVANSPKVALGLPAFYSAGTGYNASFATALLVFFRAFGGAAHLTKALVAATKAQSKAAAAVKRGTTTSKTAANNLSKDPTNATLKKRATNAASQLAIYQARLSTTTESITSLNDTIALVGNAFSTAPAGLGDALTIYRYAISDHLAISLQLQS